MASLVLDEINSDLGVLDLPGEGGGVVGKGGR